MSNLVDWIERGFENEDIEAVVIGGTGWSDYNEECIPDYKDQPRFEVLTWDKARKWLDYEFDSGYGSPKCNAIYVWSKNLVMFISQYDGSTTVHTVPRNPIKCHPVMPGG